ncbi:fatty acid elongase, putative [Leishmania tarentolae]|uniref:Elongation of fatty acids protein n=1 Tax=Leishmania tarentolae TaxID=5689 RepID=A0A640KD41_LEITA|nr:fatty acid elongase, putative [Leishmania tarentolae]
MEALQVAWDWINHYPRQFSAARGRDFLDSYPDYPVYSVIVFLLVVFYLPDYLERHNIQFPIRYLVAVWNLSLSVVSTYGVVCLYGHFLDVLSMRSFHNSVCELLATSGTKDIITLRAIRLREHQKMLIEQRNLPVKWVHTPPEVAKTITALYDGATGFSVALFGYLKTPELLDTLFLVLQRKPVSFLHWYHHIVTAIYVWLSSYMPMPSGMAFCTMNYFVHSIMYFYYFLVVMGLRKWIRPFAPVITLLQVLQMFIGMYITMYTYFQYWLSPEHSDTPFFKFFEVVFSNAYYAYCNAKSIVTTGTLASQVPTFDMSDRFWGCDGDPTCMRLGMLMYGSYCVLFAVLFKELYLDKRVHERSLVVARKVQKAKATKQTEAAKEGA